MVKNILRSVKSNRVFDTSGRTQISGSTGAALSWVLPGALIDANFATGEFYGNYALSITRASTSSLTWANGLITYTPASTIANSNLGVAAFGSAANICLQSQFAATWTATRSTVTANTVASPDTTTNAATLIEDATATNTHLTVQAFVKAASALPYTFSVYAKQSTRTRIMLQLDDNASNGATAGFDLAGGQIAYAAAGIGTPYTSISAYIQAFSNGWCRCTLIATSNTATAQNASVYLDNGSGTAAQSTTYSGNGTSGVQIWGAQLQQDALACAGQYTATTTIAVTRNTDVLLLTVPPSFGTSYTLFAQGVPHASITNTATQAILGADDNSTNNRLYLERVLTAGTGQVRNVSGASTTTLSTANTWTQFTSMKIAASTIAGAQRAVLNNGTAVTGAGSLPIAVSIVRLNTTSSAGGGNWNGYIQRIAIWPTVALPAATLQSITI